MADPMRWPPGYVEEILALLDLIEGQDDASLAVQHHELAEKYGFKVMFRERTSGQLN